MYTELNCYRTYLICEGSSLPLPCTRRVQILRTQQDRLSVGATRGRYTHGSSRPPALYSVLGHRRCRLSELLWRRTFLCHMFHIHRRRVPAGLLCHVFASSTTDMMSSYMADPCLLRIASSEVAYNLGSTVVIQMGR